MTAPRGTPSYHAPLSQNTAPVYEYACMFSRDMHKKNKKFHDGMLKFHTFNSRVMVYDLDRRYVGDLHYRGEEEFGDGMDIELDRPILVQVGARIGETQTDLGEVLNAKTKNDGPPTHTSPAPPRPVRTTTLHSQQKPRSLKDVLSSQRPVVRSRALYISPYEERQAASNVQRSNPPAKRQKVVPDGKENEKPVNFIKSPANDLVTVASVPNASAYAVSKQAQDEISTVQEVVDLSSDEERTMPEPTRQVKASVKARSAPKPINTLPASGLSSATNVRKPIQNATMRPISSNSMSNVGRTVRALRAEEALKESVAAPSVTKAKHARSQLLASSGGGTIKLRLPSRKPRPKLMHRALFCQSARPRSESKEHSNEPKAQPNPRLASSGQVVLARSQRTTLGHILAELDDEEDLTSVRGPCQHSHRIDQVLSPNRPSSPLFCTPPGADDAAVDPAEIDHQAVDEEILSFAETCDAESSTRMNHDVGNLETEQVLDAFSDSDFPVQLSGGPKVLTAEAVPSAVNSVAVAGFPHMLPPAFLNPPPAPPAPGTRQSPNQRPFRRVMSENDASFTQEVADEDLLGLTTQAVARTTRMQAVISPSKLRRTTSDPTAILDGERRADTMPPLPEQVGSGPWTSMEAFLLFDKWPKGKKKPDYGQASVTPTSNHDDRVEGRPGLEGITTARDMLRDVANVL